MLSRKAEGAGGGQEDQGQCGHGCPKKTRMKFLYRFGRFILLMRPRAPCQPVVELQVNCNTPGRIVIGRDETAYVFRSSP